MEKVKDREVYSPSGTLFPDHLLRLASRKRFYRRSISRKNLEYNTAVTTLLWRPWRSRSRAMLLKPCERTQLKQLTALDIS